jgi:hypothetical protein
VSFIINPQYDHYQNLPAEEDLFNPLIDIPSHLKEDNELIEFYKLSNEAFSPGFGIKYLLNFSLFPFQMALIHAILAHKFPILLMTRGGGKTFILAVYSVYHAIMNPGSKIILVSASFRQSKYIFDEIKRIYWQSPLLRAISDDQPRVSTDECHYYLCGSSIKALPLGTGDKIRGQRGHVILADEFNSIPIEVFDVVVRGFGAVQADPFAKVRDIMSLLSKDQKKKSVPQDKAMTDLMLSEGNKLVLSGTAGFKNGTFYKMFSQYSRILSNKVKGKIANYRDIFEDEMEDMHEIDYGDYCIIKMTYEELPFIPASPGCPAGGMMDIKMIDHARATMPKILFDMEYMAEFADDTFGFFKMRDIEAATAKSSNISILTKGFKNRHYIMGVDPAKTYDRFAIVVLEVGAPNKVVYCWTQQKETYSKGAAKMRELMRKFNIVGLAIDEGGGGLAIEELINKPDIMKDGDHKVYRYDDESIEAQNGRKLLYFFNFSSSTWVDEANALLQKNIEDKVLMFPYQQIAGEFSEERDDVLYEVSEMKQELVAIEVTHSKTGRKRFDLAPPDIRKDTASVVKFKDRYSALLLANFLTTRFASLNFDEKAAAREIFNKAWRAGGWAERLQSF